MKKITSELSDLVAMQSENKKSYIPLKLITSPLAARN